MIGGRANLMRFYTYMITNFPYISGGCSMGWTSPVLHMLLEGKEQIKININEGSWIVACMPLGAIVGPFLVAYILDILGRRMTLLLFMFVHLISWVMLIFAWDTKLLYSGRLLNGLTVGILFMSVPVYISETSDERNRNRFCSLNELFIGIGYLTAYISGSFLNYHWTIIICLAPTVLFLVIFIWAPETPYFLMLKQKRDVAYNLLKKIRYRTNEARIELELNKMQELHAEFGQTGNFCQIIKKDKYLICEIILGMGLVLCQQMSGATPIQSYTHHIFSEISPSISPSLSTIAVGIVQLVTSCLTPLLVPRLGIKVLLLISCVGVSTFLGITGICVYLQNRNSESVPVWLPCGCIIFFMIFYCLGLGPLPWVSMSELLAPNIKAAASAIVTSFCFVIFTLTTKFYPSLNSLDGSVPFFFFAATTIISFVFILTCLPSTKRLTLQQIQDVLHGLAARSTHGFYSSLFLLSGGRLGRPNESATTSQGARRGLPKEPPTAASSQLSTITEEESTNQS